jgi:tRNA (guanine-N7-)-methyltransferase
VGLSLADLPPLPDTIRSDRKAGWLDVRAWFERPEAPLEIEIGSGKGTFLVQEAQARPGTNFLGVEYAHEFYAYAADRLRRRGLGNVRLLYADAMEFLRWRTPDGVARVVHLYFPDPWPKARHHKRRMVQDEVLAEVHRVLAPGGELRIVTDHADYWAWMEERFARWCDPLREGARFERREWGESARPGAAGEGEGEIVGTNFERKYRREGRPFFAAVLVRR